MNVFESKGNKAEKKNEGYFSLYSSNTISKAELFLLFDKQPFAIIVTDTKSLIKYANISALSLTGYSNLYDKSIDSIKYDQGKINISSKENSQVYCILEHKSGQLIPVFLRSAQIKLHNQYFFVFNLFEMEYINKGIKEELNDYKHYYKVLEEHIDPKDPTALNKLIGLTIKDKQQEEDIAKDNIVLEELVELVFLMNQECIILETNSKVLKTLGYSREEIIEKSFYNLLKPDYKAPFQHKVMSLNFQSEITLTLELLNNDGIYVKVRFVAYIKRIYEQDLIICYARVTNEPLQISNETDNNIIINGSDQNLFSVVFKVSPSPMFILSSNFKVVKSNYAAIIKYHIVEAYQKEKYLCQIINCSTYIKEAKFSPIDDVCNTCSLSIYLKKCSNSGLPVFRKGISIKVLKNSKVLSEQLLISIVRLGSDKDFYFLVALDDIVERKKIEDELSKAKVLVEEKEKLKSTFISNLSHEIRTPLNGIMGFSEILINSTSPENIRRFAHRINLSGKRLLNVVQDMITVSSILSKSVKVQEEIISLSYILDEIKHLLSEELAESENQNKIGLKFNFPDNPGKEKISVDTIILRTIVRSLAKNAYNFVHDGFVEFGLICTEVKENTFYIKDTGKGIEKEKQEIISNYLHQEPKSYSQDFKGIGTGLSMSKYLIELTGGKLWFETTENKGTIFFFTWSDYLYRNLDKVQVLETNQLLYGKTVLVVGGQDDGYELYRFLLQRNGAEVLRSGCGRDAIKTVKSGTKVHLILMDIELPDDDGLETVKQLIGFNPDLKIILQSAFVNSADIVTALNYGCIDFIEKPATYTTLITKISQALRNGKIGKQ